MNVVRGWLLLALLAAGPVSLEAQRPPPRTEVGAREERGPVELLLQRRGELGLTEAQVARLEAIRRETEERNRPLVARLLQIRRDTPRGVSPREMTPRQRAELRERIRRARPLLERIRENNRAAMREVGEVLTPEQKERIREFIRERRPPHRRGPGGAEGGRRWDAPRGHGA